MSLHSPAHKSATAGMVRFTCVDCIGCEKCTFHQVAISRLPKRDLHADYLFYEGLNGTRDTDLKIGIPVAERVCLSPGRGCAWPACSCEPVQLEQAKRYDPWQRTLQGLYAYRPSNRHDLSVHGICKRCGANSKDWADNFGPLPPCTPA